MLFDQQFDEINIPHGHHNIRRAVEKQTGIGINLSLYTTFNSVIRNERLMFYIIIQIK